MLFEPAVACSLPPFTLTATDAALVAVDLPPASVHAAAPSTLHGTCMRRRTTTITTTAD